MIVVIEGPSGTGKTSWVTAHHSNHAVWEQPPPDVEPDRRVDPQAAAQFWVAVNRRRWQHALGVESAQGLAVCDTDPLKLHYVWSLWSIGEATTDAWEAEADANRKAFAEGRIGFADLVICEIPEQSELSRRRDSDMTRQRRRFQLHARLAEPLRAWYSTLDSLDDAAARVQWTLPPDGSLDQIIPEPRPTRSDVRLFDALLAALPNL